MSILIKGIDMPKDDTMILLVGKGMVIEVADGFATPKRPIEWADVPTPHGRLIDADAEVTAMYYDEMTEEYKLRKVRIIQVLADCVDDSIFTIIEAEK